MSRKHFQNKIKRATERYLRSEGPKAFRRAADTRLAEEYNRATLVVERNNHGTGILALAETACKYGRIYRQGNSEWGQTGWLTTSVTRPAILGVLNAALCEHPGLFKSGELLAECRSFVRHADGGTGAAPGTHDDRVMAMAIALAARNELLQSRGQRGRGAEGPRDPGDQENPHETTGRQTPT